MIYLNISGYKFAEIDSQELPLLRVEFKERCSREKFKGTILISVEGINLNLAGEIERITKFQSWLDLDSRFTNMDFNQSKSDYLPFKRMLVKIKKEIIAFGKSEIRPATQTAPYITPSGLKKILDDNEDIILLDTRNNYETRLGTFKNAALLDMDTFRSFPTAAMELNGLDKLKPIVTFCTGGIRCEKASAFLQNQGFKNVSQLKGGILRYFKEFGKDHYVGECFIYDNRVCLNSELQETQTVKCFNCSQPVTEPEQKKDAYEISVSCPHCFHGKPTKNIVRSL